MAKIMVNEEAVKLLRSGMTVMIGGFLGCGCPETLIDELIRQDVKSLTVITNDTCFPGKATGKLQDESRIKKLYASYIGGHPKTGQQMENGEMEVVLVPQGTLVERIRAGGAGLGGILTPTGLGTVVEEGKQVITVGGKRFLLEEPLRADVALIRAHKADKKGNLLYRRAARNFNPVMATAADVVIAEVDEIVEPGAIDPDEVHTPGIFVDILVERGHQDG